MANSAGAGFVGFREGSLTFFDAELGAVFSRDETEALLCASPLVTLEAGAIRWLAPDGRVTDQARAPRDVAEPSACTASSVFAVDGAGSVVQVRRSGEMSRLDSASGTVIGLVPSRPGALVVAYQDGRVVAQKAVL
jgi:hypothetical protein